MEYTDFSDMSGYELVDGSIEKTIRAGVEKCFKSGEVSMECEGLHLRQFDDNGNPIIETLISLFTDRIMLLVYERGLYGARHTHFDENGSISRDTRDL